MLAEKSHAEIFQTEKDAIKKQINYSNYSLHPSHLIHNAPVTSDRVLGSFAAQKIMDYKTPFIKDLNAQIKDQNADIN